MSIEPALRQRTIALVGLMGAGKSSIGRRLANALGLPFVDADEEVEKAAARSISDIFDELGEAAFRDGERRVIARLGPRVRQKLQYRCYTCGGNPCRRNVSISRTPPGIT